MVGMGQFWMLWLPVKWPCLVLCAEKIKRKVFQRVKCFLAKDVSLEVSIMVTWGVETQQVQAMPDGALC